MREYLRLMRNKGTWLIIDFLVRANRTPMASPDSSGFLRLVREDLATHGNDWTQAGFKALAVYRFGVWRMTLRRGPIRLVLSYIYRIMYRRACWKYGIEIPFTTKIGRRLAIHHQGPVVINGYATIGDDCVIRHGVTVGIRYGPDDCPTIGDRVEIGAGAVMIGRISIGHDCVIGANAVVLEDIPPNSVAVGVPARVIPKPPKR
jgi:serine O-acetyltransferase